MTSKSKSEENIIDPERLIVVVEEYGYRTWVGTLPSEMSKAHVISWWESLSSVLPMFFNPSGSFPMPLYELFESDQDGIYWTQNDEQRHFNKSNVVLYAHVHEDGDSYLKDISGEHHYHKGYGEDFEDKESTESDFSESKTDESEFEDPVK